MKVFKTFAASAFSIFSVVAIFGANPAAANPQGLEGSYLGAGVSIGTTSGGQGDDGRTMGGNVQGRFDVPNAPISLRGSVLFTDENAAFVPMVSYDLAVSENTNIYAGGGASLLLDNNSTTPLGNRDAFALTAGVETGLTDNLAVYGDVKLGINAYEKSLADALSIQVGAAYRF
ncbi:outer membrane beta-barrel protein [Prochlorothrix hollandica]|uniref:Histidine kinase n=1 Tax=Prochlorothrix hollandica PCC 9006 = CALU 1027 TaxID=317619 RepID=A0A0M2Q1L0_PROHO|nr:outer membrane beta-barrel protein [Prochlorothrix hollandica]KKJ00829.1 histidine kinase [Prochlorothrix hollandica PCC 9006 = CALU 1027]